MKTLLRRLWADQGGDDLLEYALLSAFFALATAAAFQFIQASMNTAYQSWDQGQQDRWDLNADLTPSGGGS